VDWSARRDLLESGPDDLQFVAEVDDDGRAHLRFGDGVNGFAPEAGATFTAAYRTGNGRAGNVGAEAIRHLVLREQSVSGASFRPRNPLPARGGADPEPLADVRLLAPHAFRTDLQRAVTADDYARLAEREFPGRVQRAAATLRWTGSWTEALVAVDPSSAEGDVDGLLREIRARLHRYRRIGHDVVVRQGVPVAVHLGLSVCVQPHAPCGPVRAALLEVLGGHGFFQPDNLTFGEGIALSRLIAAAQAVTGVESVQAVTFQRLEVEPAGEIESGFLPLGPLEIARLGKLDLDTRGGQ
jgi:predicted phage baseplate assembly protein